MPDSMGKRKRRDVTARKHAAREERRVARAGRKKDREAGIIEPGPPIGPAEQSEFLVIEPEGDGEAATEGEGSESKAAAAPKPAAASTTPEPEPAESDARGEAEG
jgi:hypothetical protein